jgi:hypothetical protein
MFNFLCKMIHWMNLFLCYFLASGKVFSCVSDNKNANLKKFIHESLLVSCCINSAGWRVGKLRENLENSDANQKLWKVLREKRKERGTPHPIFVSHKKLVFLSFYE